MNSFLADFILNSSNPKGSCYIETKNLDGETNLKMKSAKKELYEFFRSKDDLNNLSGELVCEEPNDQIYKFEGAIQYSKGQSYKISLGIENVLLRGCSLKNTEYVYGLTVFTGHDTKIMQNSARSKYKLSNLEKLTNKSIILILAVQVVFALIGAGLGSYNSNMFKTENKTGCENNETNDPSCQWAYYLYLQDASMFKIFCTWILIFTNFVPISLTVSLELVKFW